jgi:hypothetical protein
VCQIYIFSYERVFLYNMGEVGEAAEEEEVVTEKMMSW